MEIRFYSCRPVHAPERLALAMLKHEAEVMASNLAGDDIHCPAHKRRIIVQNASLSSSKSPYMTDILLKKKKKKKKKAE